LPVAVTISVMFVRKALSVVTAIGFSPLRFEAIAATAMAITTARPRRK
jgi:hypothetical protein